MTTIPERAQDQTDYHAYLLRLWREIGASQEGRARTESSGDSGLVWRASLEDPQASERKGFASLEDLFEFLRQQTSLVSDANQDRG